MSWFITTFMAPTNALLARNLFLIWLYLKIILTSNVRILFSMFRNIFLQNYVIGFHGFLQSYIHPFRANNLFRSHDIVNNYFIIVEAIIWVKRKNFPVFNVVQEMKS